jgi:hypothetical protein
MEERSLPKVEPAEFARQARFVGLIGLTMDVLVAIVIVAFHPFEEAVTYTLSAALVCVGLGLAYIFVVVFPRRYERYYAHMLEPRPK